MTRRDRRSSTRRSPATPTTRASSTSGTTRRLAGLVADAKARGARVIEVNPAGEKLDPATRKLAPALVLDVDADMAVMREEIFGPLLPVVPYDTLDDALDYVNARDRPLALYWFGDNARPPRPRAAQHDRGGVTVNGCLTHFAQEAQPFGGVGASGTGSYHGVYGFRTFSKEKAVYYQGRLGIVPLLTAALRPAARPRAGVVHALRPDVEERPMNFDYTPKVRELRERLLAFMAARVYPNERRYRDEVEANRANGNPWIPTRLVEELKVEARAAGAVEPLPAAVGARRGLTNLEYAPLCELMGRVTWAPEVFNCSAPDTGNMETIERYGTAGAEAAVAGAAARGRDPVGVPDDRAGGRLVGRHQHRMPHGARRRRLRDQRPQMVVVGRGRSALPHLHRDGQDRSGRARSIAQQSMLLVPAATPGVKVIRPLTVLNSDDAPHGHMEIDLADVRVPAANVLKGEGCGFEIAQGRLGPGRIHHCMRLVGLAERALELMVKRLSGRVAFGSEIARQTVWQERIAESRCMIEQARLLVLKAAYLMDTVGNKVAKKEIAMIKVVAPNVACKVIDWAIQAYGAAGVHDEFLVGAYASARSLRLADGPDEVHRNAIAKLELREVAGAAGGAGIAATKRA